MVVVFRVDASLQIGSGHVMRCLNLADMLKQEGANCTFICREYEGNLLALIQAKGHNTLALPSSFANISTSTTPAARREYLTWFGTTLGEDTRQTITALQVLALEKPTWLIVDHYALDNEWESALRPYCKKIMVIDDLADRQHDCDLLLDQTFGRDEHNYLPLVPKHCTILTGSYYALLRAEFAEWREYSLYVKRKLPLNQLLVCMGGSDPTNETGKIAEGILISKRVWKGIDIIVGAAYPHIEYLRNQLTMLPQAMLHIQTPYMAQLMATADYAITAGGSISWEKCTLGLPSSISILADNQATIARALHHKQAHKTLGMATSLTPVDYANALDTIEPDELKIMTERAATICDGLGVKRVTQVMESIK